MSLDQRKGPRFKACPKRCYERVVSGKPLAITGLLDEIKAIVKVLTNDKVLSVGAGHAFLEHFLEKAGLNIVATDPLLSHFSQKPDFRPFMKVQR